MYYNFNMTVMKLFIETLRRVNVIIDLAQHLAKPGDTQTPGLRMQDDNWILLTWKKDLPGFSLLFPILH